MKLQHFYISILLLLLPLAVQSQKQTLFVDDFTSDVKVPESVLTNIRSAVIDGITNTNRVNLVDAHAIIPAPEYSPMENALRYRAQYLLQGKLLNREATDDGISGPKFHSRENSYKEKFVIRLQLIRTSDGTTIFTRNYEETGSSSGKEASQYYALERALVNIPYAMRNLIEHNFKVHGSIVELVSDNNKKAKSVYINLGYDDPIKEGQRFDVMVQTSFAENYMEHKIGEVRIKEIVGPKYSLCKVMSKGGEHILKAFEMGAKLHIVSRQSRLFDE